VLTTGRRLPGGALVPVQPLDADRRPRLHVELVGERREARLALRLRRQVRELLALEQPLPAEHVD